MAAATYDMTGLSQKNGAVYSHLQIAADSTRLGANRLGPGRCRPWCWAWTWWPR